MSEPIFVDCTWTVPNSEPAFKYCILQNSQFFDLAKLKAATPLGSRYPHAETLATMLGEIGIFDKDDVVFYDRIGLFTGPFMRWALKSIGFENVSLLIQFAPDAIWSDNHQTPSPSLSVSINQPQCKGVVMSEVFQAIEADTQIVDARGRGRFEGTAPEPRPGLRSGHIPGSINVPYSEMLDTDRNYPDDLSERVKATGLDLDRPIITTCGSGVTAAALAYILEMEGAKDVSVYLGSWTEWGASDLPIETGPVETVS